MKCECGEDYKPSLAMELHKRINCPVHAKSTQSPAYRALTILNEIVRPEYSEKEKAIMVLESHSLLEAADELRDRTKGCKCSDCRVGY